MHSGDLWLRDPECNLKLRVRPEGDRCGGCKRRALLLRAEWTPGQAVGQQHELPVRRATSKTMWAPVWNRYRERLRRGVHSGLERRVVPDVPNPREEPW